MIRPGLIRMWSVATSHGRPAIAASCAAKYGMNDAGRCCVTRIGTEKSDGSPVSTWLSAWIPPVDAPIAIIS